MKKLLLTNLMLIGLTLASFSQSTIDDPFFDQVSFKGAFGANEDWTSGWANWTPQTTAYGNPTVTVSGELTASTTWTANNVYLIQGFYYVRSGATLTIEPGTVIRGDKDTKGTLLIERGAKLMAKGSVDKPIVFTSNLEAGSRAYGDWGGVVLCGKAAINVPGGKATIEGGPTSVYGGEATPDDADNSGNLEFVRIEFPGIPFVPDKEINGLTLGGVGSGTTLDYIQVSYSGDDSYEWFGGKVNAKHLIAFRGWDDDFDTDYGFRGMIQFAVALRDPAIADPGSGSNSFESDNDGSGSTNTPVTQPIFSNVSSFGPQSTLGQSVNSNYKRAMHLRRNTRTTVYNSVFAGWPLGLFIDGTAAQGNATNGLLKMEGVVLSGIGNFFISNFERNFFENQAFSNDTLATNDMLMVSDPFNLAGPDFLLESGSELNTGAVWTVTGLKNRDNIKSFAASTYPNPVSTNATISLNLDKSQKITVNLFDMIGHKVAVIAQDQFKAGKNVINYNVSTLPKGMYFVQITDGTNSSSLKMVVK